MIKRVEAGFLHCELGFGHLSIKYALPAGISITIQGCLLSTQPSHSTLTTTGYLNGLLHVGPLALGSTPYFVQCPASELDLSKRGSLLLGIRWAS